MATTSLDLPTLAELDPERAAASDALRETIAARVRSAPGETIEFRDFMELALYAPRLGYYMRDARRIGAAGDFVTAPELSASFSRALASPVQQVLGALGGGDIVELGAGSGVMARDLLAELADRGVLPGRYLITERSPALRERQAATLASLPPAVRDLVQWVDEPVSFDGILLANEVLDALSVRRFAVRGGAPNSLRVGIGANGFEWREAAPDTALAAWFDALGSDLTGPLADGYRSEWCDGLEAALARFTAGLGRGVALFADYGYTRGEYYHPQRVDGTLLCHFEQRAHADPLVLVGLQDLTASVDFTAVAECAERLGLRVGGFTSQTWFLMGCGLEALAQRAATGATALGPDAVAAAADLRRLLLPGEMGERVKMIALARDFDQPLDAFALRDQRARL